MYASSDVVRTNWDFARGIRPSTLWLKKGATMHKSSGSVRSSGASERIECQSVSKAGSFSERQVRAIAARSRLMAEPGPPSDDMTRHMRSTVSRGREAMLGGPAMISSRVCLRTSGPQLVADGGRRERSTSRVCGSNALSSCPDGIRGSCGSSVQLGMGEAAQKSHPGPLGVDGYSVCEYEFVTRRKWGCFPTLPRPRTRRACLSLPILAKTQLRRSTI